MRYVLPGVVCVTEFFLALLIVFPCETKTFITSIQWDGLGVAIGAFFGSGALGYLFSVIYYSIVSSCPRWFYKHASPLHCLEDKFNYHFFPKLKDLDYRERWELFNTIWHVEKQKLEALQKVEDVTDRLLNIANGHGITTVGSWLSMFGWILFVLLFSTRSAPQCLSTVLIIIFWISLNLLMWHMRNKTQKTIENIKNSALIRTVQCERVPKEIIFLRDGSTDNVNINGSK
ncbi:MAG: hypothetical protein K9K66_10170 [Desulfarculaceae bacterium]|nr:hypothetical protein [Desulfarculaceae bacterium]MCF8073773.1 hypothetical protein [Desulfarculaceae bacterium]MCF8102014.1 hypothetical protein [Desulfarculaceae bacterium]MCF8115984.1 hypothetical protein [Desulfarculaceae bacterium]